MLKRWCKTHWSTSWKLQQVLRVWGSLCPLLKVSANPEGVSELSFTPLGPTCLARWGQEFWCSCQQTRLSQVSFLLQDHINHGHPWSLASRWLSDKVVTWQTQLRLRFGKFFLFPPATGGDVNTSLLQGNGTGDAGVIHTTPPKRMSKNFWHVYEPKQIAKRQKNTSSFVCGSAKS